MTAKDPFEQLPRGAQRPHIANPAPERFDDVEWQLRVELAAAYRLIAMLDMDDAIFTHLSLRVPGDVPSFLINPYGMLFDEVTASSLVRVGSDGQKIVVPGEVSAWPVNPAGFHIHSAIHLGRADR
jgi:ribulose-5-phosphate 4-epimerase/fuculose-1-phosphate aldolase